MEIPIRGDGHYCAPEVLDLCRARSVDFILGVPGASVLRAHVATLEAYTTARVVEMKTRITLHLPSACPAAPLMRLLLERLPRIAPV